MPINSPDIFGYQTKSLIFFFLKIHLEDFKNNKIDSMNPQGNLKGKDSSDALSAVSPRLPAPSL